MEVIMKSGGKLFAKQWVYDNEKGEGAYEYHDITCTSYEYLYEPVTLLDVTLNDLFLLTEQCAEFYRLIFRRNYYEELIQEAFSGEGPSTDKEIEYLEIYKYLDVMKIEDSLYETNLCVSFHGVNETTDINYSLMFSSAKLIKNLSLRLKSDISIYEEIYSPNYTSTEKIFPKINYTLFEVLNAVYWELSFSGSPEQRQELLATLEERVEDLEDLTNDASL